MFKSICLLLIISTCVSSRDYNSILSRLFNKRTKSATPLILVLDRNTLRPLQDERNSNNEVALDSSDENMDSLQFILQQLSKKRSSNRQQRFRSDHQHRPSQRDRNQEYQDKTRSSNRVDKPEDIKTQSVLRSPIYKSLLTLRNSLRCGARSECQDECGENFSGKKKQKCENKCEKKFTCDEEPKCDECEASEECDECQQQQGSTKGTLYEPEPAGCKRC